MSLISVSVRHPLLLYHVNPPHCSGGSGKQSKGLLCTEESGSYNWSFAFAYTPEQSQLISFQFGPRTQYPAWAPVKRVRIYSPGRCSWAEQDYEAYFLAAGVWWSRVEVQHHLCSICSVAQEKHIKAFVALPLPVTCPIPMCQVSLQALTLRILL